MTSMPTHTSSLICKTQDYDLTARSLLRRSANEDPWWLENKLTEYCKTLKISCSEISKVRNSNFEYEKHIHNYLNTVFPYPIPATGNLKLIPNMDMTNFHSVDLITFQ